MAEAWDAILPGSAALTEFVGSYKGGCMWNALLAALHVTIGAPFTVAALWDMIGRAVKEGRTVAPNGAATMSQLRGALHDWYGLAPVAFIPYTEPLAVPAWHDLLDRYAGHNAIVLELAAASAGLKDMEAGIHYHGIAILAHHRADGLYGACNGDSTPARSGQLSIYHWARDLAPARPCGVLVLPAPSHAPVPAPPVPPAPPHPSDAEIAAALATLDAAAGYWKGRA